MNEIGSITVEYVVLLCLISAGCSFAVVSMGPWLVRMFSAQVVWLLLPF